MNQKLGVLLVFTAALAWSTTGLFTRVVTTDLPTTLFGRSVGGGLCVLALYLFKEAGFKEAGGQTMNASLRRAIRFSFGEIVVCVLFTGAMFCFISAFFYTTIANVLFASGAAPLITFLLGVTVLKEKADWVSFCTCVVCVVGVAIIVYGAGRFDDILGIALAFGSSIFLAAATIAAKYFPTSCAIKITYLHGFLCALVMLPFSSFVGALPSDYFYLGLSGVLAVGLGFGVYMAGVKYIMATTAALIVLLEVLFAPVWAYLLFAEQPGAKTLLGGAVILLATTAYLAVQHVKQQRLREFR